MSGTDSTRTRADIGFSDALDGFDPADWAAAPATSPKPRPPADTARRSAEATGFVSRQPVTPKPVADAGGVGGEKPADRLLVRRRRTGRNMQFNLKARPDTIETYCAIADANGWGLGETLEYAVTLLQREYGTKGS
ncbi:hypothetical protein [Frigidibacter sp. ROC022]|uniref:hypothetical protein n=1 Tax=Frigidibacter sp. ROC022 TaxID=2971796 RepID=UPI00215A4365|nr:hypothetical protein [Frigidibacter sp. ROC022]MCR8726779.1 hypothetical protein [Frigidibacter sp. ROC022]